jgi:hypothetical protein
MKPVRVILSPEAEEVYYYLSKESKKSKIAKGILKAIKKKSELIKANVQYGDPVPKKVIPKEYFVKYNITNLFRVELPDYWRMLYTARQEADEIEIIAFVLDIMDHKSYDKKFGYKKQ